MSRITLLFMLSFVFAFSLHAAQIYKWVDESGTTHYTDDPMKVPPKYRKKAPTTITPLAPSGPASKQESSGPVPKGKQVWDAKCASCHHTGRGEVGEKDGLGQITVDATNELRTPEQLLPILRRAASGKVSDMDAVDVTDDDLLAIARYLLKVQK